MSLSCEIYDLTSAKLFLLQRLGSQDSEAKRMNGNVIQMRSLIYMQPAIPMVI